MKLHRIALAAALATLPLSAFAQTTYQQRHDINARKADQQGRIAQGVHSGQLTPHETAHLERNEARISGQEGRMRTRDDGHLNATDRHVLAREQNHESAAIYRDKHNARRD
jgi:hypothetical protein